MIMEQGNDKASLSIKYMTALRGIACLMVLFSHGVQIFTPYGMYVSGCGKMGVWFFLVSSGFLTMYPYEQNRDKPFSLIGYYKKRFVKIYPVYVLVLIMSYLAGYFDSTKQFLLHLIFAEGKGHFWYMPVIVKMYLLMPVFIYARKKIKNTRIYAGGLILLTILDCCIFPYWKYEENSICLYWYFPLFVFGFLLAVFYHQLENNHKKNLFWDMVVAGSFCVLFLITPFMRKLIWDVEPSSDLQNKYIYIGLVWCVVICGCKMSRCIGTYLGNRKCLLYIGDISYSIYLVHFVVFMTIGNYTILPVVKFITGFLITFLLSFIINLIDKSVVSRWLKRFLKL